MDIVNFEFGNYSIRAMSIDGKPWFVFADICNALDITNSRMASQSVPSKYVGKTYVPDATNHKPLTTIINEPGLYRFVLRSNKPQAESFQDWVVEDVLPQIRETGRYDANPAIRSTREYKPLYKPDVVKAINSSGMIAGKAYNKIYEAQGINEYLRIGLTIIPDPFGERGPTYLDENGKRTYLHQRMADLEIEQNKFLQGQIVAAYQILGHDKKTLQAFLKSIRVDKMIGA